MDSQINFNADVFCLSIVNISEVCCIIHSFFFKSWDNFSMSIFLIFQINFAFSTFSDIFKKTNFQARIKIFFFGIALENVVLS